MYFDGFIFFFSDLVLFNLNFIRSFLMKFIIIEKIQIIYAPFANDVTSPIATIIIFKKLLALLLFNL